MFEINLQRKDLDAKTAAPMKGISQVVLFLGFILISSIARAGAPDAVEATQEPTKKFSFLSPELLSIRFADPGPETPYLASTGSFNLPLNEDFGKIVIMPKFIVMTRRNLPVEREMLTDYGRVQFAKKIFTTPLYRATFGPLSQIATYYFNFLSILNGWHPNDAEAMTLYRESERVRILSEFDDLSRLEGLGDPHAGAEFIRMRSEVWRTGFNSLYWDPFAGAAGFHVTLRKR